MKLAHYLNTTVKVSIAAIVLFCSLPVFAHHSQAAYDSSRVISFEGTVHRFDWKNPHIYLIVETRSENGESMLQQIEGLAITQAQVDGLERDALSPGTRVTVRANPNRGGAGKTVRGLNVTTLDGRVHPFYERATEVRRLEPASGLTGNWAPSLAETNRVFGIAYSNWQYTETASNAPLVAACDIEPVPFLTAINELRVIEVGEDTVIMRHDNSGDIGVRTIHLDQVRHPVDLEPSLFGHSIGHWEQETLVIDTVAYTPHGSGLFSGVPSGPRKHTTERLRLTQNRRQLNYEFSMEDPDNLVAPVSFSMRWDHRPDLKLSTEPCDLEISDRYLGG